MRKTLVAKDGYMLTNGKTFVKIVDLAEGSTGSNWYEITEEEYNSFVERVKAEEKER